MPSIHAGSPGVGFSESKECKMLTRCLIVIGLLAFMASFTGCAETLYHQKPMVLGGSFQAAKANQILNPEAGKNLEPVHGLDGQAAVIVMDKYRKSFEKPPPARVYAITIGGIGK